MSEDRMMQAGRNLGYQSIRELQRAALATTETLQLSHPEAKLITAIAVWEEPKSESYLLELAQRCDDAKREWGLIRLAMKAGLEVALVDGTLMIRHGELAKELAKGGYSL